MPAGAEGQQLSSPSLPRRSPPSRQCSTVDPPADPVDPPVDPQQQRPDPRTIPPGERSAAGAGGGEQGRQGGHNGHTTWMNPQLDGPSAKTLGTHLTMLRSSPSHHSLTDCRAHPLLPPLPLPGLKASDMSADARFCSAFPCGYSWQRPGQMRQLWVRRPGRVLSSLTLPPSGRHGVAWWR